MLNQPSTVPVKEELLAAETAVRNNVSLLEAESIRFERLISSQKRELVTLNGSIDDIKDQTDAITLRRVEIVKEVSDLESKKVALVKDIESLTKIIDATKAEIAHREDELSGREADITSAENMLQEAEIAFRERSVVLEQSIKEVEEKKKLLTKTLSSL